MCFTHEPTVRISLALISSNEGTTTTKLFPFLKISVLLLSLCHTPNTVSLVLMHPC